MALSVAAAVRFTKETNVKQGAAEPKQATVGEAKNHSVDEGQSQQAAQMPSDLKSKTKVPASQGVTIEDALPKK